MVRDIEISDVSPEDLGWVVAQEVAIFGPAAWSEATIHHDYRHGMKRYRAARRHGELLGYAVYGCDGDVFHLMNLAVSEHARRTGVGRALMEDFLAEARNLECSEAWLEVAVTNEEALGLYRSYGFEEVRVRRKYYQPGDIDGVVMRATLT